MLPVALLTFVALLVSVSVTAFHVQVPLQSGQRWQNASVYLAPVTPENDNSTEWSIEELPDPDAADHLVFETVRSLLQHWPNARMRNGHNIVPGVIPKGTLLYHGRNRNELPLDPDWVAIGPEYAYMCCWNVLSAIPQLKDECWYLTLVTTRPLKIIYFDGSSATILPDGSLDSQDLILWGESRPDNIFEELRRIKDLCEWAVKFDVDGIVRMGMDFEIMLCDFTSGVSEVSFLNLEPPVRPKDTTGLSMLEVISAGSRHDHLPGETRIQLDLARLVSFYDTQLAPSLIVARAGQERWDHRAQNISRDDLSIVKSHVETVLTRPWGSASGIDWKTNMQVIVDQFSQRFELMRHFLNSSVTSPDDTINFANKTQMQLRTILAPYVTLLDSPTDPSNKTDVSWSIPVYKRCSTMYTYPIESELGTMTDSEKLLFQAVRGTSREICRVLTKMWVSGVYVGIDLLLNTKASLDVAEVAELRRDWAAELNRLMTWLDWSVWVKCVPECRPEELCYLPTWPFGFSRRRAGRLSHLDGRQEGLINFGYRAVQSIPGIASAPNPGADEWFRPQPKCISRVEPYD